MTRHSKDHRRYLFGTALDRRLAKDELPLWCRPKQKIINYLRLTLT